MSRRLLALTLALVAATPLAARAQERPGIRPIVPPTRFYIGITGVLEVPHDQFSNYVGNGGGLNVGFLARLSRNGAALLRLDAGYLVYGRETRRSCLSETVGCLITVDVTTSNDIFVAGIGPQFMVPRGPIRPYVTGTAGLAYFFTHSSIEGSNNSEPFADTKHFDDLVFAWTGGGGVLIPVRGGRTPILIDLGARYHDNGDVSYLREGSITVQPGGSLLIRPIRSRANFISYHLGVAIGL